MAMVNFAMSHELRSNMDPETKPKTGFVCEHASTVAVTLKRTTRRAVENEDFELAEKLKHQEQDWQCLQLVVIVDLVLALCLLIIRSISMTCDSEMMVFLRPQVPTGSSRLSIDFL